MKEERITASDNKRLAKNTVFLYARTLLVMAITLFTSRVILSSLGFEDYGTYNVIGGFVAMFSLVSGTLVRATQRFINVELGKNKESDPNKIFCTSFYIHCLLALILVALLETVGLWYINTKMNLPEGRGFAANVTFQCSALAFLFHIICMPYHAVIIAFERMKAFAYITLLSAVLKLVISYSLYLSGGDRLVLYSSLILLEAVLLSFIYYAYCRIHFPITTKLRFVREKASYIKQMSFASYTFIGSIASVFATQGVNLIINLFSGVTVNAARGLAVQVQNAVTKFVTDFTTALNPQITKSYASGDKQTSIKLAYRGAKYSYFLMMIMAIPIIFKTPFILGMWLNKFPEYTIIFVRLTLMYSLVTVLSHTLTTLILATGDIKVNALMIGGLRLLILPFCYLVLKLGFEPYSVYYVLIIIDTISLFTRLYIVKYITHIKLLGYIKDVLIPVIIVSVIVVLFNYFISNYYNDDVLGVAIYCSLSFIISCLVILSFGMTQKERVSTLHYVSQKINKQRSSNENRNSNIS